jgi:hypothetical protein
MIHARMSLERCRSYARHSGKTREAMADDAGVDVGVVKRLRAGLPVSLANLERFEASIPKNWRDPLPQETRVA